jgi:DoxX-like family
MQREEILVGIVLWTLTAVLIVVFGFSAALKGTQPKDRVLRAGMTGVVDVPMPLMRFIAVCELLGIVGLVVPYLTGIAPVLTPLAAIGLGLIMVLAARIHLRLGERLTAVGNVVILAMCLVVAIGHWST